MKKHILFPLLVSVFFLAFTACGTNTDKPQPHDTIPADSGETSSVLQPVIESSSQEMQNTDTAITMTFGDTVVTAVLDDSETSKAFLKRLPLTIDMSRYGDREYYAAISELPEDGEAIPDYENGDVTYYTNGKSLAIFFGNEENSNQSNLIRMGKITSDLSVFDSIEENVSVTIEIADEPSGIQEGENMEKAEQEVLAAYRQRCDAMVAKDMDTLDRIMDNDLILRHITGATQTKEEWLSCIENEEMRYYNIDIQEITAEVNGNTAVVHHTAALNARIYGSRNTWTLSGESYYEKQGDEWIWTNPPEE